MQTVDPAWVLAIMLRTQPEAPWKSSYAASADVIAREAERDPLFGGEDGARRTAALMVSVFWFEGSFQPDAEGDGRCEAKPTGNADEEARWRKRWSKDLGCANPRPTSWCGFQIAEGNFAGLRVSRSEIQTDFVVCARSGLRMMHISFGVCRGKGDDKLLDHYAAGGNGCLPPRHDEGGHRLRKAKALYAADLPGLDRSNPAKEPEEPPAYENPPPFLEQ